MICAHVTGVRMTSVNYACVSLICLILETLMVLVAISFSSQMVVHSISALLPVPTPKPDAILPSSIFYAGEKMLFWRRPPRDHDVGQCSAVVALLGRASQGHSHSIWRRATYNVRPRGFVNSTHPNLSTACAAHARVTQPFK